jgi:hypothetical protein
MTDPDTLNATLPPRATKPGAETVVALAGTMFSALLLILTAMYAGPLWRDEVNTANVAQMPSLHELWRNMSFESFPPLWPLLLRSCGFLGVAGSDASIRVLGLYVGLFFLASLWLCARWMGRRAPILSIALLGCLPTFIFIVGANRAYGLASGLLVLSFGTLWRVVELPSRSRILWAGFTCLLFAHCVYYDVVFLAAMLAGGAMVVLRRRQWKTLAALVGIGAVSSAPLAVYLPIVHRGSAYVPMVQWPYFSLSTLWYKLGDALTFRSSGELGHNGPEVWLWIALLLGGLVVALVLERTRARQTQNQEAAARVAVRADLALFCVVSMLLGVSGYFVFLFKLHFLTQSWYYVEIFCLCAISLEGLLGASWPSLRPWGWLRIAFMVVMMTWGARAAWAEAHTRRSNVDLIANVLGKRASADDFIVVQSAWEGITFNRYYHGPARWATVPPIGSHLVHRTDLIADQMNQPDAMVPVLREITNTLRSGNSVWLVGNMTALPSDQPRADQPLKWFGTYYSHWSWQVTDLLLGHALQEQVLDIPAGAPVCCLENLPLIRFSGYKPEAQEPTYRK